VSSVWGECSEFSTSSLGSLIVFFALSFFFGFSAPGVFLKAAYLDEDGGGARDGGSNVALNPRAGAPFAVALVVFEVAGLEPVVGVVLEVAGLEPVVVVVLEVAGLEPVVGVLEVAGGLEAVVVVLEVPGGLEPIPIVFEVPGLEVVVVVLDVTGLEAGVVVLEDVAFVPVFVILVPVPVVLSFGFDALRPSLALGGICESALRGRTNTSAF